MFRSLSKSPELIELIVEGEKAEVPAAISVAAAMLLLEKIPLRQTLISGAPRAPFCMMGICFECLIEIDGLANQRACQVEVRAGMQIRRQCSQAAVPS